MALTSNANTDDNDYHLTRSSVQQQSLVAPREKLEASYDGWVPGVLISSRMALFDPLQFGNVAIEVQQAALGPAHLGLALGKSGGFLRQSGLVLVSIRTCQNRRRRAGLLKAFAESGFLALGGHQSLANRAFYGCQTLFVRLAIAIGRPKSCARFGAKRKHRLTQPNG